MRTVRSPWSWRLVCLVALLTAYTLATALYEPLQIGLVSRDLRVVLEAARLCVSLFAAIVLALPSEEDSDPARNAFVAPLAAYGVSNAAFGIAPGLLPGSSETATHLLFYPWLTARYLAGVLFLWAGLRRPRLSLTAALVLAGGVLVASEAVFLLTGGRLPLPVDVVADGQMVIRAASLWENLAVAVVPGLLFAAGAGVAWRVFLRDASTIYAWLTLALTTQAFAQLHQVFYPTVLGPTITTGDALRLLTVVLLLAGGLSALGQLYGDRSLAVSAQAADLEAQERLLDELYQAVEREEDFRAIVAHELTAPLTTMRAYAHVVRRRLPRGSDDDAHRAVEGIEAEARRMQQLVARMDELRNLELDGFRCELRPIRLRPLLEDAARFAQGLPGAHPVLVSGGEVRVHADPVRLGQALRNLLTNAARYSREGAPI